MNFGSPSFLRLFDRSHNYGARYQYDETDSEPVSEERAKQRERFAAAAIGFCLKHDREFRGHFWETICRVSNGDPKQTPKFNPENIGLEPPHWADLSFTYEDGTERYMWVVEIKAGARLQDKQNPKKAEFFSPAKDAKNRGYGRHFSEEEKPKGTKMRYIVLGAEPTLGLQEGKERHGIFVQERKWETLLNNRPGTSLTEDLVKSLGELQIGPFVMEQAKKITISKGISNVGDAWKVLDGVCAWLKVGRRWMPVVWQEDKCSYLAFEIKHPAQGSAKANKYAKLAKITGSSKWIAWICYTSDNNDTITKEIRIYCREKSDSETLVKRMSRVFPEVTVEKNERGFNVVVESLSEKTTQKDLDWFISVFELALADRPTNTQ